MKNKFMEVAIMILMSSTFTFAEQNIKDEIIDRCKKQMGEYGSTMVKACVDQDIKAVRDLNKLIETKKYDSIINRCLNQMGEYGYFMVKACVDQDIEAEEALKNY